MTFAHHQLGQRLPRWPWVLARRSKQGRSSFESLPLAWFLRSKAWAGARLAVALGKGWCPNTRPCPTRPLASCPQCPRSKTPLLSQGWCPRNPKARRLPQNQVHLVPSPAVLFTSCVTSGKELPLSEPPFPLLRGANNSSLSGCCDDSEKPGCGQSQMLSALGETAKCVTVPITANVCLGRVSQLTDIEKMLQDPAEESQLPVGTPNLNLT